MENYLRLRIMCLFVLCAFAVSLPRVAHADSLSPQFCEAILSIRSKLSSSIPISVMGPKAARATADDQLVVVNPLFEKARNIAPSDLSADVQSVAVATTQALVSLDFSGMQTAAFSASEDAISGRMKSDCGFGTMEIIASNYEYQNVPDEVPRGQTTMTLLNKGDEVHELTVARINDDVGLSSREVLALPIKESLASVSLLGYVTAAPGGTKATFVNLSPGRYYIVCFVPRGTNSVHNRGKGTPHVMLGMLKEFVVK